MTKPRLTNGNIGGQNLPLPAQDFVPESDLEKLICYADKFHSKRLRFLTFDEVVSEQRHFGNENAEAMFKFREIFGLPDLACLRAICEPWQTAFHSSHDL